MSVEERDWADVAIDAAGGLIIGVGIGIGISISTLTFSWAPIIICGSVGFLRGTFGGKESVSEMINDCDNLSEYAKTAHDGRVSNKSMEEYRNRSQRNEQQHRQYMRTMYNC